MSARNDNDDDGSGPTSVNPVKAQALASIDSLLQSNVQYQRALKATLKVIRDRAHQVQAEKRNLERQSVARLAALIQGQNQDDGGSSPTTGRTGGGVFHDDAQSLNYAFTSFVDEEHGTIPDFDAANPPISQIPTAFLPVTWSSNESERLKAGVVNYCSYLALREGLVTLDDLTSTSPIDLVTLIESSSLAIDWNHISAVYFRASDKSPQDCMARWHSLDHVAYNQAGASEEELMRIRELCEVHDSVFEVADSLETRRSPAWVYSMYRAFLQMESKDRATPWSPQEDHLLHQAIALHGPSNGAAISSVVGTRTNRQCLHRWRRTAPAIVRGAWAPEDDAALLAAAAACGIGGTDGPSTSSPSARANWSDVAKLVVGRADNQCRDRYLWLTERQGTHSSLGVTEAWVPGMDRGLVDLVRDHGPRWALIGGILGRPDSLVAAQYARIVREMVAGERRDLADVSLVEAVRAVERDSWSLMSMKAVVTRVVNAVNPEVPMFPTLASIRTLATASEAVEQFKRESAAGAQPAVTEPPSVPQPILQALYRTFAMTSVSGTCDPRPVGWAGVDSEREKQAQIAACRAMIENANRLGGVAAAEHGQSDDDQDMDQDRVEDV